MLSNHFVRELLWLVLYGLFLGAYLKLGSEGISIFNAVIRQVLFCCAMLQEELGLCLYWLTHQFRSWTIWWHNCPDGIVVWSSVKANLLITGESREGLRSALGRMKVQRLFVDIWVSS